MFIESVYLVQRFPYNTKMYINVIRKFINVFEHLKMLMGYLNCASKRGFKILNG